MALTANLVLFLLLFLPLTFLVGYPLGFYVGPTQGDQETFPLFVWALTALPLLLPAILWVPLAHLTLRLVARRRSHTATRVVAAALAPLGFLAVHAALFGTPFVSVPLLTLIFLPGAVYGASLRLPRRPAPVGS